MSSNLWLDQLPQAVEKSDSARLAQLFSIDLEDPQVSSIQNDIFDNSINIESTVEKRQLLDNDWPGIIELAKSYLRFCQGVDPNDDAQSFDLYADLLTNLQIAFANSRGAVLGPVLPIVCRRVVAVSVSVDSKLSPVEMIRTMYVASILLKLFNSIRGEKLDRNAPVQAITKKDQIMYVATLLCRVYFKMNKPASCANVFSNIHTANIRFSAYSRAQRVEYRYYLGRFYLFKSQFAFAYRHLQWAFDSCLTASKNKRLILIYLVPAAIVLGILPTKEVLDEFGLTSQFWPLVEALKSANYQKFMTVVDSEPYHSWYISHQFYLALRLRTIVALHRQVLYKVWKYTGNGINIKLEDFARGLQLSIGTHADALDQIANDKDFFKVENICISLISQGFVKGIVFPRNRVLRLRSQGAFPIPAEVHQLTGPNALNLTGHEQWMNQ